MPKATSKVEQPYKFPAGEPLPARLSSVEERVIPYYKKDQYGNRTNEQAQFSRWRWKFTITEGEFEGEEAIGDTEPEYTTAEANKVRHFTEALLGRELAIGEELDTDAMLDGLECYVVMRHDDPRQGKGQNADRTYYPCEVDELYPKAN